MQNKTTSNKPGPKKKTPQARRKPVPQNAPHGFRNERQMRLFVFKTILVGGMALVVAHLYTISGTFFSEITGVLKTVFLSIFLGMIFVPFLNIMNKKGIPDWGGILIIYAVLASFFTLFVVSLFPILSNQFTDLSSSIQNQIERLSNSEQTWVENVVSFLPKSLQVDDPGSLEGLQKGFEGLGSKAAEYIDSLAKDTITGVAGVTNFFVQLILVITFTFFFAIERHKMHSFLHDILPLTTSGYLKKKEKDMLNVLGAWLRGQVILGFSIFIATYFGLWFLDLFGIDIEQKFPLAFIAGLTEFVPYLGPLIALVPALFVTLGLGWDAVIGVVILYFLIQRLENNILVPIVMSKSMDMSAFTVLFVMLVGASLLGVIGILIAVPVTSILSLFLRDWIVKRKSDRLTEA